MAAKGVLVKFPAEVLAELDATAKARGISRTALILERCDVGGGEGAISTPRPRPAPVAKVDLARRAMAEAEASAAHLAAAPRAGQARAPAAAGGAGSRVSSIEGLQFGPRRRAYGEMSKGAARQPGKR